MNYMFLIIGILFGAAGVWFFLRPKLSSVEQLDSITQQQNKLLKEESVQLIQQYNDLQKDIAALQASRNELKNTIFNLQEQAEKSAAIIYDKSIEVMQEKLTNSATELSNNYQAYKKACEDEYVKVLQDSVNDYNEAIYQKQQELARVEVQLLELKSNLVAAIEANKRAQEIKDKQNFYKLNLSAEDVEEIEKLREVAKYLRDSEPLNKIIWKVYYEKPYTDLIGRVVGNSTKTGIYKITNIENQMCYIGQAVNIADRWRQHIKRGIGAETPTKNKLYPAMKSFGVENFTFEIVEECSRDKLDLREDYWQEYFKAKEFGYSIK